MPIRVLVVDPQEVVLIGLQQALLAPDLLVVNAFPRWPDIMRSLTQRRIDVILVDPKLNLNRIFVDLEQVRWVHPKVKVLFYTDLEHPAYATKAAAIGVRGLIPKTVTMEQLQSSIRTVHRGESLWTLEELKRSHATMLSKLQFDTGLPLTLREKALLAEIAKGSTNKLAAENLKISYETVKVNVQQIFKKLSVEDRTQAALWGLDKGLI